MFVYDCGGVATLGLDGVTYTAVGHGRVAQVHVCGYVG